MRKLLILKVVNALLGLAFLGLLCTLPWMLELVAYEPAISRLHKLTGTIFAGLALIHVGMNFGWLRANFFGKKRK